MALNAYKEQYEMVEVFGKPALLSEYHIDRDSLPDSVFAYDLRHGDDIGRPVSVEPNVTVNHYGTLLTREPLEFGDTGYLLLGDADSTDNSYGLNYMEDSVTLKEWMEMSLEDLTGQPAGLKENAEVRKLMEACVDLTMNASFFMGKGTIQVELLADLTCAIPDLAFEFESSGYDRDDYFGEIDEFSKKRLVEMFGQHEIPQDDAEDFER